MYMICELRKVAGMATLDNTKGSVGQICEDNTTGNLYVKHGGIWQQLTTNGAQGGNSAQAANTAVVANGASLVLKKSDGTTTSAGNAGLNSPATAVVAAGAVTNVKCSA
jgi:hypothetical protein